MDTWPDWYNVDENMTIPKGEDLLGFVVDDQFPERTGIYIVGYLVGAWWVRYSEGSHPIVENQKVTHWRYLPNPPR